MGTWTRAGLAACAAGPERNWPEASTSHDQDENAKIVVEVKVLPAFSTVVGKSGWFGEFGKC